MLGIGEKFPEFSVNATVSTDEKNAFEEINNKSFPGKWTIYMFYPKDFTFVCPTEIQSFGDMADEFEDRDAQLMVASTDSEFVHLAWRTHDERLKNLPVPMLADLNRNLVSQLGIQDKEEGVAQRATYIVDPDGIIRHVSVNDMSVGRNPNEILRILDALQTDELCPCNWEKGQETLSAA
ncbi:peroxiredoxin (alkyl hydroperoxide reductase subunit C) [Natronospira proteinivora]|uniref:Alkyl hydroperoxide reductase C n=1 Tax=Natronospira proteinivora TaxID=1807133 RepID=A0ABT1G4W4_9GAMM|nr:peroxiredoxin [Natronospira proteinivora]MCP1726335.1 peroxiredoxin (alkyl hydroperoxide reductase subunit C) [Natronospira proteinivora]